MRPESYIIFPTFGLLRCVTAAHLTLGLIRRSRRGFVLFIKQQLRETAASNLV